MEQLNGPNVQVVLRLKEGRGFDKITNPMCIVATLNGLSLETDLISPEPSPLYSTDLIWEARKNILRKMRSGQEPLKLECFEFKENGIKDKIGYSLLSLRSAQIVPRGSDSNIKINWHKLLGLRNDVKGDKPEFSVSLTIEDRDTTEVGSEGKSEEMERAIDSYEFPIPYVIPEERLIQLGPISTCRDLFLLTISAGITSNLHFLVQKSTYESNTCKVFTFWYKILDNEVQSKPFTMESNIFLLNEKIVMRIRTSISILKGYLRQKPNFLIVLTHGGRTLGESEIDLRPLLSFDSVDEYVGNYQDPGVQLSERCLLKTLDGTDEVLDVEERPFLDLQLMLTWIGNDNTEMSGDPVFNYPPPTVLNQEILVMKKNSTIGCHQKSNESPKNLECGYENDCASRMNHFSTLEMPEDHQRNTITYSCNEKDCTKSIGAYHCYCLHVSLNALKLKSGSIKNIEFRFHHPKAEVMFTLYPKVPVVMDETLRLENIGCKLHFISGINEIKQLLITYPPKISVHDEGRMDKSLIGQTILDVRRIFNEATSECQYEARLFDTMKNEIGTIEVKMNLEDHGPYDGVSKSIWSENFGPPVLDDSLVYKIIDEFETWKERQQEMFKAELKRKEERRLNLLSEEWQRRRESLETKLACSVEQCRLLADNLNKATNDLRTRRLQSIEKEAKLIKTNEDLKWSYEKKLRELQNDNEQLKIDCDTKLLRLGEEKKGVENKLAALKIENDRLEKIVRQQSEEILKYQKGTLPSERSENLLQELKNLEQKLKSTVQSKTFFKEQWGKAVREIHKMKMEHQTALEVQIKSSREELRNIDLEQLLQADSAALSNDKLLLNQIQREINIIKPDPIHKNNIEESGFIDALDSCSRLNVEYNKSQYSAKSNEQDQRLRNLIEERDTLLKTGSYTIDDAIIIKLNTEIRSMLIS